MEWRLKAEIYVQALLHRVHDAGATAVIARRGNADAGGIFVRVNRLDGTSGVLTQASDADNVRYWRVVAEPATADADIEARLAREMERDPDIWIVEIEDRASRHFLEERIAGEWAV